MDKDTEELEHELKSADIKDYLEENRDNLRQYTLAQYLEKLLAEKGLVKAEVVKRSNLSQVYAYHIFCGYKQTPAKKKVLSLA
ncbi:MAG: XRE family transcriptional regulator [Selenomonadaceae bacterium]|nr:XRE family transcriptional regulator [Selenomonadaceae bacterium]